MKTTAEVEQDFLNATPMELACATNEMMAQAIRAAVEQDRPAELRQALDNLKRNVEMMQRWLDGATH